MNKIPTFQGKKLLIKVHNEMEVLAIKRKYAEIISNIYQHFGFPPLVLETEINCQNSRIEEYEKFLTAKQKEDQERGMQALR